ncbi:hypothetical protein FAZ15_12010 [Sphingobacterium olei]|uniref:Uncharacterized protein n=1 Tax=Sphingobacterium olei TaxID=2571155 RepID=A0A4U0P0Q9_9SPHI|nr:hypothetical protein [Sphingobacterium olei]TJZ60703.1 hypothetical protein FAZ15_12010 [Sphingobacterium olei]
MAFVSCSKYEFQDIRLENSKVIENLNPISENDISLSLSSPSFDITSFTDIDPLPELSIPTTESEAELLTATLLSNSQAYLLSKGYTASEVLEEFSSWDSPEVAVLGLVLYALEEGPSSNSDVWDCALRALGVDRLIDWAKGKYVGSYAARKALISLIGKTATRLGLGYIGTAMMVAEFVHCVAQGYEVYYPDGLGSVAYDDYGNMVLLDRVPGFLSAEYSGGGYKYCSDYYLLFTNPSIPYPLYEELYGYWYNYYLTPDFSINAPNGFYIAKENYDNEYLEFIYVKDAAIQYIGLAIESSGPGPGNPMPE